MIFEILGWMGFILLVLAFTLVNFDKWSWTFFPLNVIDSILIIIYEISLDAWSLVAVNVFIVVLSTVKILRK